MKVLIATPTYEVMDYCFESFLNHIRQIEKDNFSFDIVIVDNSLSERYFQKISKINEVKVLRDNIDEKMPLLRLTSSRNKILDYAKENNYDYLLMMDSDVLVPPNILKKLLDHKKEIVSGLYFNHIINKKTKKIISYPICWKSANKEQIEKFRENYKSKKWAYDWINVRISKADVLSKKLIDASIPSPGCCLMSRKAFCSGARYGFTEKEISLMKKGLLVKTEEINFFRDLKLNKKIDIFCDTSLICFHEEREKYSSNKEKHPLLKGVGAKL